MPLIDFNERKPTTECEIDGKRIPYDACATGELESAKEYHTHFNYIGSGTKIWINGTENNWEETYHFFVRKQN